MRKEGGDIVPPASLPMTIVHLSPLEGDVWMSLRYLSFVWDKKSPRLLFEFVCDWYVAPSPMAK